MPIPAALIPVLAQIALAAGQGIAADRMEPGDQPKVGIPAPIRDYYKFAEQKSRRTRLPGQDLIEQNLGETTANRIASSVALTGSGAEAGAMASMAYDSELREKRNLGIEAARMRDSNEDEFQGAKRVLADFMLQEFTTDKLEPYLRDVARQNQMQTAGIQNLFGALNTGASAIASDRYLKEATKMQQPGQPGETRQASNLPYMQTKSDVQVLPKPMSPVSNESIYSPTSFLPPRLDGGGGMPYLDFNDSNLNSTINQQIADMLSQIDFSQF